MRDIVPHGFVNSILLHLQKKTCSIQEVVGPIAVRADFAGLRQFLPLRKGFRQTTEANLSCRNVMSPKAILEYSIDQ